MKITVLIILSHITVLPPVFAEGDEINIYVSPKGNYSKQGTTELPLTSLNDAKNHVHEIESSAKGNIDVRFRGENYFLDESVVFRLEHSGDGESTITTQACLDEEPVFSSGFRINDWKKFYSPIPTIPELAHVKILVTDIPKVEGFPRCFFKPYDAEGRLPRAYSKGFIPITYSSDLGGFDLDKSIFHFPFGTLKGWPNLEDIEILVRPHHIWGFNILPLESVDRETQITKITMPASYKMGKHHFIKGLVSCWVDNVLEALDEPGVWVLNAREGWLYPWPRAAPPEDIMVPLLREYFRVKGQIDKMGPNDIPVRNLCFRDLTNVETLHPDYFKLREEPLIVGAIQRNILYHTKGNVEFFNQGLGDKLMPAREKEADTDCNIYYCADNPAMSLMALEKAKMLASISTAWLSTYFL